MVKLRLQRFFALFTTHGANGPQPTPQPEGGLGAEAPEPPTRAGVGPPSSFSAGRGLWGPAKPAD